MSEMIARRYARAVFELAKESGKVGDLTRELGAFAEAYASSQDLRDVDVLPSLQAEDRRAIVEAVGARLSASDLTVRTVAMIAERQRLSLLPDLARVVDAMADDHLGVLRGTVTSAAPLDPGYRTRLKQKIEDATGKRVLLTFQEDDQLIAGIVTQIGDRVVDGSVRGKLNALAASLREA